MRLRFSGGSPVRHGAHSYVLQDTDGQIALTQRLGGLIYALVGPEHAMLHDQKRAEVLLAVTDQQTPTRPVPARIEGIIPVLESAHAMAVALRPRAAWAGKSCSSSISPDEATRTDRHLSRQLERAGRSGPERPESAGSLTACGRKTARAHRLYRGRRPLALRHPISSRRWNAEARI